MTHTKKRILAMLLAVVLMFSSLPFSVSADEITSELLMESTLESQPEGTPAEETEEPASAEDYHHHLGQLWGRACALRTRPIHRDQEPCGRRQQ